MITTRNRGRSAGIATAFAALSAVGVLCAGSASAATSIDIQNAGSDTVGVNYACESGAGVSSVQAMVGGTNADKPSSTGTQMAVTCDGSQHSTTIPMSPAADGTPVQSGDQVQVRVALVDSGGTVVTGQAKAFTLQ